LAEIPGTPPLIDTHCHLDLRQFDADREQVIERAMASGVRVFINPAIDLDSCRRVLALADRYGAVYAALGVHPNDCADFDEETLAALRDMAQHPKVVAIGEIGLDYYWEKVDHIRRGLEGWVRMAQKYDVRVCLHTHSGEPRYHMGVNCAALMHLLAGFDPKYVGAYLDPGHMAVDGEPFSYGVSMVRKYLAIVALKDVLLFREDRGDEGGEGRQWVTAGKGCVAWSKVFAELVRVGFDGPLTVHGEYRNDGPEDFRAKLKPEVAYFRGKRDEAVGK